MSENLGRYKGRTFYVLFWIGGFLAYFVVLDRLLRRFR